MNNFYGSEFCMSVDKYKTYYPVNYNLCTDLIQITLCFIDKAISELRVGVVLGCGNLECFSSYTSTSMYPSILAP